MPTDLIQQLNTLTPLGLAAGLAYIIYLQIESKKGQNKIANNHLHGLPEMAETLKRIEQGITEMGKDVSYIRGRINGQDK